MVERLIPALMARGIDIAVITNDLVTAEDAERVRRSGLIDPARVSAVEAGACPHTVIREDPTLNIEAADELERRFPGVELILIESGGDNLASTFSRDLTDFWMFVIDVAGGDDIPRKRGPGVIRADLLVINKTDLAPYVGVNLDRMHAEALAVRGNRPVLLTNCRARRRHRGRRRPHRARGAVPHVNAQLPQTHAHLDLSFARRGDRTVFDRRLFRWPFVLTRTFHLDAAPRHMLTVILQTSSSALLGEDRLRQRLALGQGSAVHLTTQGATAVHRAVPGQIAEEFVCLSVGAGAYLEYLPQPRILFPDAALSQSIEVDVAAGGTAILSDAFTVHDPTGAGQSFRRLRSAISVRFDADEPVLIDRLDIAAALQPRATAFASMLMLNRGSVPVDQSQALALSAALAELPDLYGAASLLPGDAGIGVRLAARDLRAVRLGLDLCRAAFRRHATGEAPAAG